MAGCAADEFQPYKGVEAIILMLISTATVLLHTIRAARTNPAEVLKKE